MLAHRLGDALAEGGEEVGPGLEAVLVQVVARAAARAQDEVALEVRDLADLRPERRHLAARRLRASGSRRSASGVPSAIEIIEPSSA